MTFFFFNKLVDFNIKAKLKERGQTLEKRFNRK